MEVLVWISDPQDFVNWPDEMKLSRYQRVLEWHDYAEKLFQQGKITHLWGSHQLLSRAQFATSQGVVLALYNVENWLEFDALLLDDPLRDISRYATTPLSTLFEDRHNDLARLEMDRRELLRDKNEEALRVFYEYRALYNQTPEYVGRYEYVNPANEHTDIYRKEQPGDPLHILLLGFNPNEYITMWDDTRKFIHHEKVSWWHDYTAMLIHQGKISHAWGTHDFCFIEGGNANRAAALCVFKTATYDEFDELYTLDPIRTASLFWSVLLQPIANQRLYDEEKYKKALARYKNRSA